MDKYIATAIVILITVLLGVKLFIGSTGNTVQSALDGLMKDSITEIQSIEVK